MPIRDQNEKKNKNYRPQIKIPDQNKKKWENQTNGMKFA